MRTQPLTLLIPLPILKDARDIAARTGTRQAEVLRAALAQGMVGLRTFAQPTDRTKYPPKKEELSDD